MTRNSVPQRWWAVGYLRTSPTVSGSPASSAWIVMCSAPWYWNTRWMSGERLMSTRYPSSSATRISPSKRCWTRPLSTLEVVTLAMNSGSRKKKPMPKTAVMVSISATDQRPSSRPSPLACRFALRMSQRVPTTSVSYRTTSPRMNGHFDQGLAWNPASRRSVAQTIWPSGCRNATAIASRPRIRTPSMSAWPP